MVKAYGISPFTLEDSKAESELSAWMFNMRTLADAPPDPWIASPSGDSLLQDPLWKTTMVSTEKVIISAVESHLAEDIVSTLFEFSTDGNNWVTI